MEIAYRLTRAADKLLNTVVCIVLVVLLLFGSFALWDTWAVLQQSSGEELMPYKPTKENPAESLAALREINPDVCGWLTIDGTQIDYPLLIGESNSSYINTDFYGEYAVGGSLFLDYRNSKDFSDFNTIIHGHNMSQSRMFSDIKLFYNQTFFSSHGTGTLYTPQGAYELEVFAFKRTDSFDYRFYTPNLQQESSKKDFCEYITETALHYRDVGVTTKDRLLVLSTCYLSVANGRDVLLVRIVP